MTHVFRTALWTGLFSFCLCMMGCRPEADASSTPATPPAVDPAETVTAFLQALFDKRFEDYYALTTYRDRASKPLKTLQAEFAPSSADLVTDFMFRFTDFKIDSTHVETDTARVYVTARSPNMGYVLRDAAVIERDLGQDTDLETKLSLLAERYRMSGSPRDSDSTVYTLVREDNKWHVVVGWADPMPDAAP